MQEEESIRFDLIQFDSREKKESTCLEIELKNLLFVKHVSPVFLQSGTQFIRIFLAVAIAIPNIKTAFCKVPVAGHGKVGSRSDEARRAMNGTCKSWAIRCLLLLWFLLPLVFKGSRLFDPFQHSLRVLFVLHFHGPKGVARVGAGCCRKLGITILLVRIRIRMRNFLGGTLAKSHSLGGCGWARWLEDGRSFVSKVASRC